MDALSQCQGDVICSYQTPALIIQILSFGICLLYKHVYVNVKGIVRHFGKYAFSISCQELDEKIDTTLHSFSLIR